MATFLILFLLYLRGISCQSTSLSGKLKAKLFENYDKSKTIIQSVSNTTVKIGISVIHLDIDENNRIMTSDLWMRFVWQDKELAWEPKNFGNVSNIKVKPDEIWKPDITLYNSADVSGTTSGYRNEMIIVYSNGEILWVPSARFHSWCELNLCYWPKDTQECSLKFGSWVHHGHELNLAHYKKENEPKVDVDEYKSQNHEWKLIATSTTINTKYYDCCPEPYRDITFELTLQRSSPAYKSIIILPAYILMLMTISSFLVPTNSNGKLITNGFSLIGSILYLLYFANTLPFHEVNVPIIVILFANHMALTGIAIFLNIICIKMVRDDKSNAPPRFFKLIFSQKISKILCLSGFEENFSAKMTLTNENDEDRQNIILNRSSSTLSSEAQISSSRYYHQNQTNIIMREWMFVAAGLERVFLVLYVISFLIVSFTYA